MYKFRASYIKYNGFVTSRYTYHVFNRKTKLQNTCISWYVTDEGYSKSCALYLISTD